MRRLVLGLVAALAFAAAPDVGAQTMRIPKDGEPALALALPPNWTVKYDDLGNLQYSNADHSLNIQQLAPLDGIVRQVRIISAK